MVWYYMESGRRIGPVTDAEFEGTVRTGKIRPETQVWREGMEKWSPFGILRPSDPGGGTAVAEPPTVAPATDLICSLCGKTYAQDALIRYKDRLVCWSCKPAFLQILKEGAVVPGALVYAGFWPRFAAKLIDWVLLGIVSFVLGAVIGLLFPAPRNPQNIGPYMISQALVMLVNIGFGASYVTWFLGKHGATPGKMALGIKVVLSDGRPVSYTRAFARHFAEWISAIVLMIGYLMVAFDDKKRALHDRICDTRVVRK
jgi:uncharacterized RDD family membrane protein YckC